jgi:phosphoribosylamine--glycine ligase
MNILIIGAGGREHAITWKIAHSPLAKSIYIAPGNPGTAQIGRNLKLNSDNHQQIIDAIIEYNITLVVIGPEAPLVSGLADSIRNHPLLSNVAVVGPGIHGAQLEGSKDFSKSFMQRHNIPTAAYKTFTKSQLKEAYDYIITLQPPYVIKADGLAAGKGVIIASTLDEAEQSIEQMLIQSKFGEASSKVVIEEFLSGIELSVFVLTDGTDYVILPEAKDYKRIGEGDTGPNTGGMGAISPVPFATPAFMNKVEQKIIKPTITGLKEEGIDYKGFIFFGLINCDGEPKVIEYNARMGDPETEVVMPRIESDIVPLLYAAGKGELNNQSIKFKPEFVATVMLVSKGYPDEYPKGLPIDLPNQPNNAIIFHAGTSRDHSEQIVTSGGRVIAVSHYGESIEDAFQNAYNIAHQIKFEGVYFRNDLGKDLT